jgi:DNA-binding PadR family transcriptional regulator
VWVPQTGSIYPALKKLEASGLVSSEERDGTDYYSLTKEGNELVVEVLAHSPRDLRLMTRYFDLLGRAAEELHGEVSQVSRFQNLFESGDELESADRRAMRLRLARERIAEHLAMIDRELNEMEGKDKGDER